MTATFNVNKMTEAERAKWLDARKVMAQRKEASITLMAAVLRSEMGMEGGVAFLNRMNSLEEGEAFFQGPDGMESVRCSVPHDMSVGYSVDPLTGANWAIRAVTHDGQRVVVPLDFDAAVAVADSLLTHISMCVDSGLDKGHAMRGRYNDLLEELAADHLSLSGERAKTWAEAKRFYDVQTRSHAMAAEQIATEKAEKKVEGLVRKLSQAASMPQGIERSMMLEEVAPMIRKAFGSE